VSPWFASAFLLLSYSFSGLIPTDVSVDPRGTVWVLAAGEPLLTRLSSDGERVDVQLDMEGLPCGLAVSPTGTWAVSCPAEGRVLVYDRDDILVSETSTRSPGDLVFSGLELWVVDTASGSLGVPGEEPVARNCAGRNSRLSPGTGGRVLVCGPSGVFLVERGRGISRIADSGWGCFSGDDILLLHDGYVFTSMGDTLHSGVEAERITSSPFGGPLVVWGERSPAVLE
jgi:DNA-binding beta-propeller fold protein YncE